MENNSKGTKRKRIVYNANNNLTRINSSNLNRILNVKQQNMYKNTPLNNYVPTEKEENLYRYGRPEAEYNGNNRDIPQILRDSKQYREKLWNKRRKGVYTEMNVLRQRKRKSAEFPGKHLSSLIPSDQYTSNSEKPPSSNHSSYFSNPRSNVSYHTADGGSKNKSRKTRKHKRSKN